MIAIGLGTLASAVSTVVLAWYTVVRLCNTSLWGLMETSVTCISALLFGFTVCWCRLCWVWQKHVLCICEYVIGVPATLGDQLLVCGRNTIACAWTMQSYAVAVHAWWQCARVLASRWETVAPSSATVPDPSVTNGRTFDQLLQKSLHAIVDLELVARGYRLYDLCFVVTMIFCVCVELL
jgi:hypothetical protein